MLSYLSVDKTVTGAKKISFYQVLFMTFEELQLHVTGFDCVSFNMASDFDTLWVYLCMIMCTSLNC